MSELNPKNFFDCFCDNSRALLAALQALYDSEINFSIATLWDIGFDAKLGDEINGFKAEECFKTFNECIYFLADKAVELYPDSKFAEIYKERGY